MTVLLDLLQAVSFLKVYHILPSISAAIVFLLPMYEKNDTVLITLITDTFTIFSITLSTEYLLMFLFFGFLPGQLTIPDKVILVIGIILTYLTVLDHCAKGTRLGNWTSKIINKYSLQGAVLEPVSPFENELIGLKESSELFMSNNRDDIREAYRKFAINGQAILSKLEICVLNEKMDIKEFHLKYNECKQNIDHFISFQDSSSKINVSVSISEFIGKVDGVSSPFDSYIFTTTVSHQSSAEIKSQNN